MKFGYYLRNPQEILFYFDRQKFSEARDETNTRTQRISGLSLGVLCPYSSEIFTFEEQQKSFSI